MKDSLNQIVNSNWKTLFNRVSKSFSFMLFIVPIVFLVGGVIAPSIVLSAGTVDTNSQDMPDTKELDTGQVLRRNAGSEWSREKIKEYLSGIKLEFDPRVSSLRNECVDASENLESHSFQFIEPTFVTDNWNDPKLDDYRAKYEDFKYGLGFRSDYGPDNAAIPSWNITIYNLDSDQDGDIETVLYGEALKAKVGNPGASKYLIFEDNSKYPRGAKLNGDPGSSVSASVPENYYLSAIIKIEGSYIILVLQDYKPPASSERQSFVELYFLGLQEKSVRGAAFNSKRCRYSLIGQD